jgi:phosphoribosylanthranilate isomerase
VTHLKICGFRTSEHILTAIEAGADSIGLVFVEGVARSLNVVEAGAVLKEVRSKSKDLPEFVGLFADQPFEQVNEYIEMLKLDAVQLCGNESMDYCSHISIPIYKVITVDPLVPIAAQMPRIMLMQQRHALAGHKIIMDTKVSGEFGGTGQSFDWDLAADLANSFEMTLAGGLSIDNIGQALDQVRPWGVDTSSGVETDGQKDHAKIIDFAAVVRGRDLAKKGNSLFRFFRRT